MHAVFNKGAAGEVKFNGCLRDFLFGVDNLTLENTCEDPNNDSMCALCVNNGIIVRLIVKICVRVLWQLKKLGTRFKSDGDDTALEHHQEHPDEL